jgi:hypothetical protein
MVSDDLVEANFDPFLFRRVAEMGGTRQKFVVTAHDLKP